MSKQNIVKSFGNANTGSGTVIKFTPFTSTDTMLKRGVTVTINTQHNCITFMKEYENKSLEELRYEDFLAGRTGPQQTKSSVWLQKPGTWPNTSTRTGIFGNPKNNFLFSLPYTGFASTGVLGSQPQQTNSIFGKPVFAATTSARGFAFNATHTKNTFGSQQKPVGTAAPQTPFLFRTATSPFASAFTDQQNNKQMTTTNVFNEKPKQTSVGGFGADLFSTAQNTSESSAVKSQFSFNQSRTATSSAKVKRGRRIVGKSLFGAATTSATGFGFNTTPTTNTFGSQQKPVGTFPSTGVLGSQPQQTNSIFGKPEFGATGSGFNATPTTNTFGSQQKPVGRSDKDLEIATNVKHGNDVNSIKMSGLTSLFDFESPKMLYKESWKTSSSCECEAMHSQDLEELKLSVKSLSDRLDKLLLFNNQNECHTKDKSTNISLVPWSLFNPKLNLTEKKVPKDTDVQWLARILNGVIQTVSEQDRKEIYLLMVLVSTWPSLPDYVKTFIYNRMNILWQNENQKANCSSVVNERQP